MICNGTGRIFPGSPEPDGAGTDIAAARRAAAAFPAAGEKVELSLLAGGMINTSFLCVAANGGRFVLQRINSDVFPEPETLMANQVLVCAHLEQALMRRGCAAEWHVPTPFPAADGSSFFLDDERGYWRLLPFIPGRCGSFPRSAGEARKLGRGLGLFHALLADFGAGLEPVIPGFHRLSCYLAEYDAIAQAVDGADSSLARMHETVARGREEFSALEKRWQAGELGGQAIHGDPRCENFILADDGSPVALIDLDTVMHGPPVLDLADCVRSCLAAAGGPGAAVVCRELVCGWQEGSGGDACCDISFLPLAVKCILFELGLRFFTDHLRGDRYFRVSRPGENFDRARRQFSLIVEVDGLFQVLEW